MLTLFRRCAKRMLQPVRVRVRVS